MVINQVHDRQAGLNQTIGALHAAAQSPQRWTDALGCIRTLLQTSSTAYVTHNADRSRVSRMAAENDPEGQRINSQTLLRGSIFYRRGGRGFPGEIIRNSE
jgi:hypothetical protein